MPTCKITFLNEVEAQVTGLDSATNAKCIDKLKYLMPYRFHIAAYRLGRWDGSKRFYEDNGKTFNNTLSDIIPIIVEAGYTIEIEDKRTSSYTALPQITERIFADHLWPAGHILEGKPILLRDDQVECINEFSKHRHAIEVLATGFGKCVAYDTLIPVYSTNEAFCEKLNIEPETMTDVYMGQLVETLANVQQYDTGYTPIYTGVFVHDEFLNRIPILNVIKKRSRGIKFTHEHGELTVSDKHFFRHEGKAVSAIDVASKNLYVDKRHGIVKFNSVEMVDTMDFYDIEVPAPHWYIDTTTIIHHNTIFTAALCKIVEDQGRTLTIVPSKSLVEQTVEDFELVGLDVGRFYGEVKEPHKHHIVSTWQSLDSLIRNRKANTELYEQIFGGLIQVNVDEAHSAKAESLGDILGNHLKDVPIRRGFTGTIPREEYDAKMLQAVIGSVVKKVTAKELQDRGILSRCHIKSVVTHEERKFTSYDLETKYLSTDGVRMEFLRDYITTIAATGNTLVLINYVEMGKTLNDLIPDSEFVYGNTKMTKRSEVYKSIHGATNAVILATYPVAAVGLNIPRIFNVVLIDAGKSFVRVIQTIGRGIRIAKDKNFAQIHDISADCKYSKNHAKIRKDYYDEAEYPYDVVTGDYTDILKMTEVFVDENK